MYAILLSLHSITRWLVLASLLFAVYRSWRRWLSKQPYTRTDHIMCHSVTGIAQLQMIIGFILYFVSPVIDYFLDHFSESMPNRELRFFGMEHVAMMFLAISFLSIGSSVAKRKTADHEKFRAMAIWFSIALVIILLSIPWPFSPFAPHRPYFRPF